MRNFAFYTKPKEVHLTKVCFTPIALKHNDQDLLSLERKILRQLNIAAPSLSDLLSDDDQPQLLKLPSTRPINFRG